MNRNRVVHELFRDAAPKTLGDLIVCCQLQRTWETSADPLERRWSIRQLFELKGWKWDRWAVAHYS